MVARRPGAPHLGDITEPWGGMVHGRRCRCGAGHRKVLIAGCLGSWYFLLIQAHESDLRLVRSMHRKTPVFRDIQLKASLPIRNCW
jgi:hypothetical protein